MIPRFARWLLAASLLPAAQGCGRSARHERTATAPLPALYFVPTLLESMERVYRPSAARYLNDHTIVRDQHGVFHLFGITNDTTRTPALERSFLHASAKSLRGPWSESPDALYAQEAVEGCCIWAPFVMRAGKGWRMYYNSTQGERVIRRADSADLSSWKRTPGWVDQQGPAPGGRDVFVLISSGRRYLYSVGVDAQAHGQIVLTTQDEHDDASGWSSLQTVIEDPEPSALGWGNLESPFVVPYKGLYYLFLTRTTGAARDYFTTLVFVSDQLDAWQWRPITELHAHAAEVLSVDNQWFLTSAGLDSATGEMRRGLSLARLAWLPISKGLAAQ